MHHNLYSFAPAELVQRGETYIMKTGYIYAGNDEVHTAKRAEMVFRGLHILSEEWL